MANPHGLAPGYASAAWRASGLARPSTSGGDFLAALPASGPGQGRGSWPTRPSTAPSTASDGPKRLRAPEGGQSIARAYSTRTFMRDKPSGHEWATASKGRTGRESNHGAGRRASALQGGAECEDSGDSCKPSAGRQRPWSALGASAMRSPSSSAVGTPMSGFSPRVSRFRPSTGPSADAGSPNGPDREMEHAGSKSKVKELGAGLRSGAAPHTGGQAEERPGGGGCREGLVLATSYGTATSQGLPHARPLHVRGGPRSIAVDCSSRAADGTAGLWPVGSQHVQRPGSAARAVPLECILPSDQATALHEAGAPCEGAGDQRSLVAARRWRPSSAAVFAAGRPTLSPSSTDVDQAPPARAAAGAPQRAATAPAALGAALGVPAGVRLARPGSGGSPTSRRAHEPRRKARKTSMGLCAHQVASKMTATKRAMSKQWACAPVSCRDAQVTQVHASATPRCTVYLYGHAASDMLGMPSKAASACC